MRSQLRLDGASPLRVDSLLVHAGGIVIADLPRDGVALRVGLGGLFQDLAEHLALRSSELGKAPPARLVRGDRIALHPVAAGVLIEIGTRIAGLIHRADVEPEGRAARSRQSASCWAQRAGAPGVFRDHASCQKEN